MRSWDAVETVQRLRAREVSPREVIEGAIARAEAARPLGAIVTETFARAHESAERASGPLAGVPSFVKDLAHVEGVRIGWGTRTVGDVVSKRSEAAVKVMEAMGLVSLGKSATPEFGFTATTEPLGRPPCRNPWDRARSPGGSSGGAASLVASGVVPIAHASDGGGSIRIPASSCGLVGLKPTRGRLDMEGSNMLPVNVAVHGVVTRSVRDTIAFWSAVDEITRPRRPIGAVRPEPGRLRIAAFTGSPIDRDVDADVRRAVEETARLCEELGHRVDVVPCPFEARDVDDFLRYWAFLAWTHVRFGKVILDRSFDRGRLEPWTLSLGRWCEREPGEVARATLRLRGFGRRYAALMEEVDVLISPVLAHPPPLIGHLATDLPFETGIDRILDHCPFTGLINAAGAPGISLPLARSGTNLPIGVQLAGRAYEEGTLLSLALQLEAARPWPALAPEVIA